MTSNITLTFAKLAWTDCKSLWVLLFDDITASKTPWFTATFLFSILTWDIVVLLSLINLISVHWIPIKAAISFFCTLKMARFCDKPLVYHVCNNKSLSLFWYFIRTNHFHGFQCLETEIKWLTEMRNDISVHVFEAFLIKFVFCLIQEIK